MKQKTKYIIFGIVAACIGIVALLAFLMKGTETRNSSGSSSTTIGILTCINNNVKEPFFTKSGEISPSHSIKVTFRNGIYDKFDYTYDARFSNIDKTKESYSLMRADYNIYMSGLGLDPEELSPVFSNLGTELRINLFIPRTSLTVGTAKLLFLNEKDFTDIDRYDSAGFKSMYSGKGFTCQYSE